MFSMMPFQHDALYIETWPITSERGFRDHPHVASENIKCLRDCKKDLTKVIQLLNGRARIQTTILSSHSYTHFIIPVTVITLVLFCNPNFKESHS